MQVQRRSPRGSGTVIRPGFSLIELLFVVMISAVLLAVAIPQLSRSTGQRAAVNARDAFIMTAAQARAAASRTGDQVMMVIEGGSDRVHVINGQGTQVVPSLDLQTGPVRGRIIGNALIVICYSPAGFAQLGCGLSFQPGSTIEFTDPTGTHTARARLTLAQVERL